MAICHLQRIVVPLLFASYLARNTSYFEGVLQSAKDSALIFYKLFTQKRKLFSQKIKVEFVTICDYTIP